MTKRFLKKFLIDFEEINLAENPAVLDQLRGEGYTAAPIVKTENDAWSGFRPDKLQEVADNLS